MKDKKKKNSSRIYSLVLFLVCAVLGGLLGLSIIFSFGEELQWWQLAGRLVEGLILFFLAFFLQVIFHEFGHMVAGLIRGWSFMSFMILGFVLVRREGRFHLSRFVIPGVGGQCLMMPPKGGDTDFGIALYNAGGVLMNALIAVLAGILLVLHVSVWSWGIEVLLASLSISGLFFALTNGIPACQGGIPNDGKNIEELRKDSFATHVFLTTMGVMGRLQQGCPVEEAMDGYLSDGHQLDYANPIHVMAVNFDLSSAIARLDFERAYAILKSMKPEEDKIISLYQKEILLEEVFLYLVAPRNGVDVADLITADTLRYFEMQTAFRPTALRVKYAFARLYECNKSKAEIIYRQFQKVCSTYHVQGEIVTEQKLIEYVRNLEPMEED